MAFEIDSNYTLKIRKGTSGTISIEELPTNFVGYTARLVVKKTPTTPDTSGIIIKTTTIASDYTCVFALTESDTDVFIIGNDEDFATYKWGIKAISPDGTVAENIVPVEFNEIPDCLAYPEIGGSN